MAAAVVVAVVIATVVALLAILVVIVIAAFVAWPATVAWSATVAWPAAVVIHFQGNAFLVVSWMITSMTCSIMSPMMSRWYHHITSGSSGEDDNKG